ncbi:MAG TPA: glycosyltransferase family 9 protein, partial [Bryobacteraceae bacterium]|nr:glycosyltransferase family 9 protein [Bryobacteraceae bacterium]
LLNELLASCDWRDELLVQLVERTSSFHEGTAKEASTALFRGIVEVLGDHFEPKLCEAYSRFFSRVIELLRPDLPASQLVARYQRVRTVRECRLTPSRIYVLSRVTLGADVAVTSVIIHALKQCFRGARIVFVGSRKNYELFAADSRMDHMEFDYKRNGTLRERLKRVPQIDPSDSIIVDPDSRLTQLGLIPICPEDRYFFFESRGFLAQTPHALPQIAAQWCGLVFQVPRARPFIAPDTRGEETDIAISFGVGENEEKRVGDEFERQLLEALVQRGRRVVLDRGAGSEEAARADAAAADLPNIELHSGPYAPFAARIERAKLYIGYDSAGQHVAAACRVPLISVFKGHVSQKMLQRWSPTGHDRITVVPVPPTEDVLGKVLQAVDAMASPR